MGTQNDLKHILIVEDDEGMRKLYKRMFESCIGQYEVEILNDARVAFGRLKEERYDLIILDIVMEPMDGRVFYACLKNGFTKVKTPVLIVSVLGQDALDEFKGLDNINYLKKPITQEQLMKRVEKLLAQ